MDMLTVAVLGVSSGSVCCWCAQHDYKICRSDRNLFLETSLYQKAKMLPTSENSSAKPTEERLVVNVWPSDDGSVSK